MISNKNQRWDTSAFYYTYIDYLLFDDLTGSEMEMKAFILLPYIIITRNIPDEEVEDWVGLRFPHPFNIADPKDQITKEEQLDTDYGVWSYNRNVDEYLFESHTSHFVREFDDESND